MNSSGAPIFVKFYGYLKWLFQCVERFPKSARPVIGNRMLALGLETLEDIVVALYSREKVSLLERVNIRIELLRVMSRMVKDLRFISVGQFEYAVRELNLTGAMVGGWIKQQRKG